MVVMCKIMLKFKIDHFESLTEDEISEKIKSFACNNHSDYFYDLWMVTFFASLTLTNCSVMIFSLSFLIDNNQHQPKILEKVASTSLNEASESKIQSVKQMRVMPNAPEPKTSPLRALNLFHSNPDDLELLKEIGGRGTTRDPVTHHQRLSAFAKEFNSSRYEV